MADLALTANLVEVIYPRLAQTFPGVAAEAILQGQAVYLTSSGTYGVADMNASGKHQIAGLALQPAGAKQAFDILKEGHVGGFTITQAYNAQIFGSDTAGALADAAGTASVPCGRIVSIANLPTYTKVLYFRADWVAQAP